MTEIVAYRYRYKDALTWVHSTTEPARHPNLIVEPLCVADGETDAELDDLRSRLQNTAISCEISIDEGKRLQSRNDQLRKALKAVEWWAQQKCPCHAETPNPCPLCGASVENLEACKAVESVFPRQLLSDVREALGGRS